MGQNAEDLQGGLKNIAKSMDQAKWSKYGIDTRDAAGNARDANDIFLDTLDLLSKIPSETERNRVGTELLGKGYQSLAPMIGKTRTEYEDMLAAVEDGQVITDEEQQKAERMRKAQDALGDAFGEVKLAIGELAVGVAPLIEAFAQIISVVGKVSAAVGDFLGSSASMRETIDKIGLDKFVKHLDESGKSVEEMTQFLVSQGFTLDEVKGALEENGLATAENKEATDDAAEATAALNEELQDEAELARDAAKAEQEKSDAMRAAADATFALHDAQRDLNDKLTELPAKLAEAGGNLATIQGLLDDVAQSSGKVSDEQVRLAEETATANGKVLTQTQRLDIWNQSMLEQANTAAPEARQAIIDYVASVNGIPPEKVTEILALLDQGKIDEAQAVLDETSKNRNTTIKADADTKSADTKLAQIEKNNYQATVVVKPDTSWWDKAISSLNSQQQRVGNIGGHSVAPSSVQTINVNLPRGVRYTDISRAMQSHTRRAGRRYAAPAPVVTYARR